MSDQDFQEKKMDLVNQYFEVFDQFFLYVVFKVAGEQFGIEALRVQTVARYSEPLRLPRTPSYILGLLNFRGQMIPLLNLEILCGGRTAAPTDGSMIVVVESGGYGFGLLADEIIDCKNLPQSGIHPVTDSNSHISCPHFQKAVFQGNGAQIRLLDPDKIAAPGLNCDYREESDGSLTEKIQITG
jgi:purine-binding chemotaxis protein CheW